MLTTFILCAVLYSFSQEINIMHGSNYYADLFYLRTYNTQENRGTTRSLSRLKIIASTLYVKGILSCVVNKEEKHELDRSDKEWLNRHIIVQKENV